MKITNDIFQVGGSDYTVAQDAAVYLIHAEGHAAVVDAGCGGQTARLLKNIQECGLDPDRIDTLLITHCHFDHTGGAAGLREATGCRIVAHAEDAVFLEQGDDTVTAAAWYGRTLPPFSVDMKLTEPLTEINLGRQVIQAIHTPGHSPGSVVYLMESDGQKVLFAQDVHGPLHPDLLSDENDYRRSLQTLIDLKADILCEGHFGIYMGTDKVRQFIQSFL